MKKCCFCCKLRVGVVLIGIIYFIGCILTFGLNLAVVTIASRETQMKLNRKWANWVAMVCSGIITFPALLLILSAAKTTRFLVGPFVFLVPCCLVVNIIVHITAVLLDSTAYAFPLAQMVITWYYWYVVYCYYNKVKLEEYDDEDDA